MSMIKIIVILIYYTKDIMDSFWVYFQIGLKHVLDSAAYDHILFLAALVVPYAFKDWKRVLILLSIFTLGHTLALLLSVFGIITIKANFVEFLIPITIFFAAIYNLFTAGKSSKNNSISWIGSITLFFGIIHGLGFSNYFNSILSGSATDKLVPTLEFAIGIEAAQIVVVFVVLALSFIVQNFMKFSKRDWTLVVSSLIIGIIIPMIIESEIWIKK